MSNNEEITTSKYSNSDLLDIWQKLTDMIDYHVLTAAKYIKDREEIQNLIDQGIRGLNEPRKLQLESIVRSCREQETTG